MDRTKEGGANKLTDEQISEFMEEKFNGRDSSCWRCGTNKWQIAVTDDIAGAQLPPLLRPEKHSELSLAILPIACSNCGTMWLVSMEKITEWHQKKKDRERRLRAKQSREEET